MFDWLKRRWREDDDEQLERLIAYHHDIHARHGNSPTGILHLWEARDLEAKRQPPSEP